MSDETKTTPPAKGAAVGSTDGLGAVEKEILAIIPEHCGLTTHTVAVRLGRTFGHNQHTYSGWVLAHLKRLEQSGRIRRLDNEKPVVWTKCEAPNDPSSPTGREQPKGNP